VFQQYAYVRVYRHPDLWWLHPEGCQNFELQDALLLLQLCYQEQQRPQLPSCCALAPGMLHLCAHWLCAFPACITSIRAAEAEQDTQIAGCAATRGHCNTKLTLRSPRILAAFAEHLAGEEKT